jgi:mxaD protein
MPKVEVRRTVEVPAERLFGLLGDFGNTSWVPGAQETEVEGDGPGMVRIIRTGPDSVIRERLEALDPKSRTLSYSIPEGNPLPVSDYLASVAITPSGDDRCEIAWSCSFEPVGVSESEAIAAVESIYEMLVGWVKDAAEKG